MVTAMDTAMDELQHPPSPGHLADMYTSQNGTVVRTLAHSRPELTFLASDPAACALMKQYHVGLLAIILGP